MVGLVFFGLFRGGEGGVGPFGRVRTAKIALASPNRQDQGVDAARHTAIYVFSSCYLVVVGGRGGD